MPDEKRRRPDDEEFEVPEDESERGIAEDEDEFEDADELDDEEEEDEDEDPDAEKGVGEDRGFTAEVGSEGGSQGDLEAKRRKPRVMRGSEATTTAKTDEEPRFDDRHAGGGIGGPRR
jgi:hypothetical protein